MKKTLLQDNRCHWSPVLTPWVITPLQSTSLSELRSMLCDNNWCTDEDPWPFQDKIVCPMEMEWFSKPMIQQQHYYVLSKITSCLNASIAVSTIIERALSLWSPRLISNTLEPMEDPAPPAWSRPGEDRTLLSAVMCPALCSHWSTPLPTYPARCCPLVHCYWQAVSIVKWQCHSNTDVMMVWSPSLWYSHCSYPTPAGSWLVSSHAWLRTRTPTAATRLHTAT